MPVKSPAPKAAVKVPVAPEPATVVDAKAQSGATAAPTNSEGFLRVSKHTNKGKAPRFSWSSTSNVTITTVLLSFLVLLLLTAAAAAQDVIVLPKLGRR